MHARLVQGFHGAGHGQEGLAGAGRADTEIDVVGGDRVQVLGLVGTAATHGAAFDLDRHVLWFVCALRHLLDIGIVEPQMDGVVVERGGGGFVI